MQLARRTDDRYRDLPEKLRREAVDWLTAGDAPGHFIQLVRDGGTLETDEQGSDLRRIAAEGATDRMMRWDVAIIGGGPAGLMAAACKRRRGDGRLSCWTRTASRA